MKRYLILENGDVFCGEAIGAEAESFGELVFTTGMCGYLETLTDPSYFGQIVLQTFPLIGNYGVIEEDFEGDCFVKGYVVNELCNAPSNFRCGDTLDDYLKEKEIVGISGVDTREITKIIRESGVMNAAISNSPDFSAELLKGYTVKNAVSSVSHGKTEVFECNEKAKYRVALYDLGAKRNIVRCLLKRGCEVICVPYNTTAEEVLALNVDGIMLSNGPGDPAENTEVIEEIKKLLGKKPMFGICLGHQLMALSLGAETEKLKYGHRGVNQPVKEVNGKRTYITSQNHGYAVVSGSVKDGEVSFINANDGTCEGIDYKHLDAFSVQFHPEACSGPHDTEFLFDKFINLLDKGEM